MADRPHEGRIAAIGVHLPGPRVALDSLPLTPAERARLPRLGQEGTHVSEADSTALMIEAGREALNGQDPALVRMVISAPSLLTAYGLEIPAVAVRAALGLARAECLNLAQGCVGVLRGLQLAARFVAAEPERGDVLVVTSCRASGLTTNMNHGAFFWGDGGGAALVTARPGPGARVVAYAERAADAEWGAMRVPGGESEGSAAPSITVAFSDAEAQLDYVRGEQARFAGVLDDLLREGGARAEEIAALFLPSTGRNRLPVLLSGHKGMIGRVRTDFRLAHLGGVDVLLAMAEHLRDGAPADGEWWAALSPAFAAQWGGALLRYRQG